jgi:phosphate starvation-inducible protein PhoH
MTTWLWKKDQQKADAQVQTSVDKLSTTLEEVKIKYGATNLRQRKPAVTRSVLPTAPMQPAYLDAVDDDPLLMTDGAAVTGIGNASLHQKQQRLSEKKQQ